MSQFVVEGTWEEIARAAGRLSGKRLRLTLVPDDEEGAPACAAAPSAQPAERIRALDLLAEQYRHLPALPPEAFERESLYDDSP